MSTYERARSATGPNADEVFSSTAQDTAEFVEPKKSNGFVPCPVYYVRLCGDLGARLEDLADRRGMRIEDIITELITEGLVSGGESS
ncbi:hypothetical protein [Streptomyces sp. GESEQ-35]|uniref:hypothetical protein n=1 Tax=Streptomyces sp. GESEQ-35 TaxID=2812657 RepID=UPI001B31F6CA|nr:hypothetical protein [Streptomyces sp. GESEQ-35]